MIRGVINEQVIEYFSVADELGNLVPGIDSTAFTAYVYNPSGNDVSSSVNGSFVELTNGNYKYLFTPDATGNWYIMVTHPVYFPWGKTDEVQVYDTNINTVYSTLQKVLGLVHRNFYIDETSYDEFGNMVSARVRIYSDAASVGTNFNVLETYLIEADAGTECGRFASWKQVVI